MKFTIRLRLFLGFGSVCFILVVMGLFSIFSLGRINHSTVEISQNSLPSVDYAHTINTNTSDYRIKELRHVLSEDTTEMRSLEAEMDALEEKVNSNIEQYKKIINGDEDRLIINSIESQWADYLAISDKVIALSNQFKTQEAMNLSVGEGVEMFNTLSTSALDLVKINQSYADKVSEDANSVYSSTRLILLIAMVIAVAIAMSIAIIIINSIVRPINKLVDAADKLALGDVNINVQSNSKDEIGNLLQSFARMIESIREQAFAADRIAAGDLTIDVTVRSENDLLGKKLSELVEKNNEILTNISSAAEQVSAGSIQLSDSSIALSQGASEQASSVEELTASLAEISSQTKRSAQNANQANELAETAKSYALQGNEQMNAMLNAIAEINESSASISKIIKVIDDIAFQTNILALNAAVEAARAGQHGKGFAVVAEEVRNLAARSANAAKETTLMIQSSIKKAEHGTTIAKDTAGALKQIEVGIEKVATLINEIAVASNEQATGIGQINQNVMLVSQVVQTNAATSEETAAASEELSSQASFLTEMVGMFQLKKLSQANTRTDLVAPETPKMIQRMTEKMFNSPNSAGKY